MRAGKMELHLTDRQTDRQLLWEEQQAPWPARAVSNNNKKKKRNKVNFTSQSESVVKEPAESREDIVIRPVNSTCCKTSSSRCKNGTLKSDQKKHFCGSLLEESTTNLNLFHFEPFRFNLAEEFPDLT